MELFVDPNIPVPPGYTGEEAWVYRARLPLWNRLQAQDAEIAALQLHNGQLLQVQQQHQHLQQQLQLRNGQLLQAQQQNERLKQQLQVREEQRQVREGEFRRVISSRDASIARLNSDSTRLGNVIVAKDERIHELKEVTRTLKAGQRWFSDEVSKLALKSEDLDALVSVLEAHIEIYMMEWVADDVLKTYWSEIATDFMLGNVTVEHFVVGEEEPPEI